MSNKKSNYPKEQKFLQLYNNFLKRKIKEYCNKNNCFEIYWDYRDDLEPKMLQEACEKYKEDGFERVEGYLESQLLDMNLDYDNELFSQIKEDLKSEEFYTEDFEEWLINNCDIVEDLANNGYAGIEVNLESLLSNSEFEFNISFATDEEKNSDMTSLINVYGSYRMPDFDFIEPSDFDNAFTYLIHQQGHTIKEYYEEMYKNPLGYKLDYKCNFVESLVDENVNNTSESMSELIALVKMNGKQALDFMNYLNDNKNNANLEINKDCRIGVFNEWSGCCGMLDIQLEKNFIIPKKLIRDFQIEGSTGSQGYTVNDVCGLTSDCWTDTLSYTDKEPELIKEDIPELIEAQRNIQNENDEEEEV